MSAIKMRDIFFLSIKILSIKTSFFWHVKYREKHNNNLFLERKKKVFIL